jgi:hypothetical protein
MRKLISIMTIICLLAVTMPLTAGEDSSQESSNESGEESSEGIGTALLVALGVVVVVGGGLLFTTTGLAKKRRSTNAAVIFNEAAGSLGEKPNVEILARLYEISVDEVIDKITEMAAGEDLDIGKALRDEGFSETWLTRLGSELENYSREKTGSELTLLHKFREKAKEKSRNIDEAACPSLEMAEIYRSLLQEESR